MHFATYYRWLVYRFLFAQEGFGQPRPDASQKWLLDIGCKEGAFARALAPMAAQIVGLDISFWVSKRRNTSIHFVQADAQCLPFQTGKFDFVIMNDVLEHIPDDRTAARHACAVLAMNGRLWLSTPAINYSVGPSWVTTRFERAWGHVRRGYWLDDLTRLFSALAELRVVVWPEPLFRAMQLPNWLISRGSMALARRVAELCFIADQRAWSVAGHAACRSGHLYLSGVKRRSS